MTPTSRRALATALFAAVSAAGCSSATTETGTPAPVGHGPVATALNVRPPRSQADVDFMQGMIPHHAQAILISKWAPTHDASEGLQRFAERVVVAQGDEIALMRTWLADRGEFVPAEDATHHRMNMNGMQHDMLMPGMLSPEELAQLDKARGVEFDRLFLTFMIRHHQGAMDMVNKLFASDGAGQDETVFRLGSDIYADQSSEVRRMQAMLDALPPASPGRDDVPALPRS